MIMEGEEYPEIDQLQEQDQLSSSSEESIEAEEVDNIQQEQDANNQKKRKIHKLSLDKKNDFNEELARRGVLYLARIPPRMTPTKIKFLLQEFNVTRIFLQQEDPTKRKARRRKTGKDTGKRYTEGWIEFADKKVAKQVAQSLNQTRMTNRKRDFFYDDLWNLKYLPKFSWSHLTEKVAYERRVQEQKLRLETLQAKRETSAYQQLVQTGKKLDKIAERRAKKQKTEEEIRPQKDAHRTKQILPLNEGKKSTKPVILKSIL